jgi:hypothetical protein
MVARIGLRRLGGRVRAFIDPLLEQLDLLGSEPGAFILRRHTAAGLAGDH